MEHSKVGDFFYGMGGCIAVNFLVSLVSGFIAGRWLPDSPMPALANGIMAGSYLFVNLTLLGVCIAKKRSYMALGYAAMIIIPVLLIGACFLMMTGSM